MNTAHAQESTSLPRIAGSDSLDLRFPPSPKGIGSVILSVDSPHLIADVVVESISLWPDDRGYFLEVQRLGQGLAAHFPFPTTQISVAVNHPGIIKAFHYHLHQTDCWNPVSGMLQVALADLRVGSPTFGARNTFYVGTLRPWRLLIPAGVAHGYKVIGAEPSTLIYLTDKFYDPKDEGRIAYTDASINYDWELQHK